MAEIWDCECSSNERGVAMSAFFQEHFGKFLLAAMENHEFCPSKIVVEVARWVGANVGQLLVEEKADDTVCQDAYAELVGIITEEINASDSPFKLSTKIEITKKAKNPQ